VSRSVKSVAGAMEQLEQSIGEISRSAALAADVAGLAVESARGAEATVLRLEQASDEIGGITNLITSIAEQTNLLALNATIEAARAGDAGMGFAVVAGEVKELAKATAGATENISSKVEAIRRDIRAATLAIGKVASTIGEISAHQTTIATAVEEQTATTKDIGSTLSDAAAGAQRIAGTIEGVADASRETAGGAASTQEAAQALVKVAEDLEQLVRRFSTGGAVGGGPRVQTGRVVASATPPQGSRPGAGGPRMSPGRPSGPNEARSSRSRARAALRSRPRP
jgi:methyl-accepting chemotaxis protein